MAVIYNSMVSLVKNPPANAEDWVSILGTGKCPGEGNGNPLQYSCQENPMDRGAWWATVHNIMTEATWHARTCTRALLSFLSITSFLEVQFFTECYFFPYSFFFFKINSISHSTFVLQEPFLSNRKLLSSIGICSQMLIIFW